MTKKTSSSNSRTTLAKLIKWNSILAVLHALQGIAVVVLSTTTTLPLNVSYLTLDPALKSASGGPVLVPAVQNVADVNLGYLVAAFFFMSALAHAFIVTVYRRRYGAGLEQGINRARWFEYAASASTMMVAIGFLVGMYDLASLVMLFALTAVMNLLGLVMEVQNQKSAKPNWLSYNIGCLAGIVPWIAIGIYLWAGYVYGSKAPTFVYWIFVSIFIFFSSFALNMYLQYRRVGKWADYLYGEKVYMILSLVAKSLLAWQVFGGTLRP